LGFIQQTRLPQHPIPYDLAVAKFNHSVGGLGISKLVGHHHNGLSLFVELVERVKHLFGARSVEICGWLVGKKNFGLSRNGSPPES